jgi:hyperosmotically inducible protein
MNVRTVLMTAAASLALTGLAGCNKDADNTTTSRAPDTTTTTPPSTTTEPATPPVASTTPTTPPAADATAPSSDASADRSSGQTVDDATVTAKVKAALLAESGVDGTKINVDTFNGRVTLKGEVPSKSMADRAVQVARGIEGVKDVDNRLNAAS